MISLISVGNSVVFRKFAPIYLFSGALLQIFTGDSDFGEAI